MKITTKTIHLVDYGEFERAVTKFTGVREYEFAETEESSNDTSHSFDNIRIKPLDKYDQSNYEKFLKGDVEMKFMGRTLLQVLVNKGICPEGDYVIRVSW
jgi:hypothetical protein